MIQRQASLRHAAILSSMLAMTTSIALAAPPAPPEGGIALVGGAVHTGAEEPIEQGTVIIKGDRIVAAGKDIQVPKGALVIDCKGKVITPGLVESDSAIGLVEIPAEVSTSDQAPKWPDPVRAAVNAADAIDIRSMLVGVARRQGVTSAVSIPRGGLIAGRSAWIDLVGPGSRYIDASVRGPIAMHASLNEAGAQSIGGSRTTSLMRFREVLDDARVFKAQRAAFERNALYHLSTSRLDLAALQPVLSGEMRVVIGASRAADILAALELAKKEKLRIALLGVEEGWLVAGALAASKVPVIVDPMHNLPHSFESRNTRADNAALLQRAGVEVAIATRSSHQASGLRFVAGTAVRAGFPHEAAIRAVTWAPAMIYGLDKQYGSIQAGKIANVVVWSGDPLEPSAFAERVIIRGEVQPTDSRQTHLAERYLKRHGLGQGAKKK